MHFVIMGNVFFTHKYVHEVYDLKGSTYGRAAAEKEKQQAVPILKVLWTLSLFLAMCVYVVLCVPTVCEYVRFVKCVYAFALLQLGGDEHRKIGY